MSPPIADSVPRSSINKGGVHSLEFRGSRFRTGAKMWRAFFLALGITLILVGCQLFFVEKLEVKRLRRPRANASASQYQSSPFQSASFASPNSPPAPTVMVKRKDWMPWSLLAVGTIVVIYTFTIPKRGFHD
jgi:hypothetical protein